MTDDTPAGRPRKRDWIAVVLGIGVALFGAVLIVRPFQSLSLLAILVIVGFVLSGLSELAAARRSPKPWAAMIGGFAWIAAALVIGLWPGLTLRVLAWIVGLSLGVSGLVRIASGVRGTSDERLTSILLGAASVLVGVLAVAWPDITVFVIGVAFGVRMVILGISQAVEGMGGPPKTDEEPRRRGRLARSARTIGAVGAVLVAAALFGVSTQLNASEPDPDAFYNAPEVVPSEHGQLVRAEAFTRAIPDGARAWRILYTTERADGSAALASGLLVVPDDQPDAPYPLLTWSHGTTGQDQSCAPSLLPEPFESGAMFVLPDIVDRGWAFVATDYIGLGADPPHGYLVGGDAGRGVLDAARAARQIEDVRLSDSTVIWGHSQGGGSALWAGALATSYAPDAGVIGVAALSAAGNLPALVAKFRDMPGGSIFGSYVIEGYADTYPDVRFNDYVRGTARLVVREMADRCLGEKGILVSVLQSLIVGEAIWARDPGSGSLGARLEENVPTGRIDVPLFMGQGLADPLVLPDAQQAYVDERCAAGQDLEYRTYDGLGHVDVVQAESPLIADLFAWTQARWEGAEPISTC